MNTTGLSLPISRLCMCILLVGSTLGGGAVTTDPTASEIRPFTVNNSFVTQSTPVSETNETSVGRVNVSVDGKHVVSGGNITTTDDPRLSFNVTAQSQITLIVLRIDGRTYRSYTPNATNYSQSATLELQQGAHAVAVVTKTQNNVSEYNLTVIEDSAPPTIQLTEPISVDGRPFGDSYDVDRSRVEIAGTLQDRSNVTKVSIKHTYQYSYAGETEGGQEQVVIRNPNDSVSVPVHLIPPQQTSTETTNQIAITLHDRFGQVRRYEFELDVTDDAQPEIDITDIEALYPTSKVQVDFSVGDAVGIRSVRVTKTDNPNLGRHLLLSRDPEQQPVEAEFTHTLSVGKGASTITLVAVDTSGQQRVIRRELNYSSLITPDTRIDVQRTRFRSERRVRAVGNITEGKIERVRVETVAANGTVLDIQTVHNGTVVSHVEMNETLRAGTNIYPVRVRVRTLDATGTEHLDSVSLSQSSVTQTQVETVTPQSTTTQRTPPSTRPASTTSSQATPPASANNGSLFGWLPDFDMLGSGSVLDSVSAGESSPAGMALLAGILGISIFLLLRF